MKRFFRIATMAYLIVLGVTLGAVLFAGIVVAPVVFGSEKYLGEALLSRYQEGLIMTENFIRLSYLVDLSVAAVIFYELYKFKTFQSDKFTFMASFVVVATGLMFGHYYLPDIVRMQEAGEAVTNTKAFLNTHKGSEINFKLFAFALLVLIFSTMKRFCR